MKKILIISPHTDDELFGVGGTLLKLKKEGHQIKICLMSCSDRYLRHLNRIVTEEEQWSEFIKVCKYISTEEPIKFNTNGFRLEEIHQYKIVKWLDNVIEDYQPDIIYTCEPSYHQEHKDVFNATMAACRPTYGKKIVEEILLYESPTSTWSNPNDKFIPNIYVDIEPYLEEKIKIFKEFYKIQHTDKDRKNLSEEGLIKHAIYRGYESGLKIAESFKTIKKIIL
jgi:LmbE family N-acetylglucosaminyl deacetylase